MERNTILALCVSPLDKKTFQDILLSVTIHIFEAPRLIEREREMRVVARSALSIRSIMVLIEIATGSVVLTQKGLLCSVQSIIRNLYKELGLLIF